jgi:hypothetical protein
VFSGDQADTVGWQPGQVGRMGSAGRSFIFEISDSVLKPEAERYV